METWTVWKKGDTDEQKRKVWNMHKQYRLDDTLRRLVELYGKPDAVMIRRRR